MPNPCEELYLLNNMEHCMMMRMMTCLCSPGKGSPISWEDIEDENTTLTTEEWKTKIHKQGYCALYDMCGHTSSGGVLSCPQNIPAQPLAPTGVTKLEYVCPQLASEIKQSSDMKVCCTEDQINQIQSQMQAASIFLLGCPACLHNFKHLICLITCSPNQASFTNVTEIQKASDTNSTSVSAIDIFMASEFGTKLFDSCSNVIYPPLNQKAMKFIGGGATNYEEWMEFLGTPRPGGSPFLMKFISANESHSTPPGWGSLNDTIPGCGDSPFTCSCGDCPSAPGCEVPPPPPDSKASKGCFALGVWGALTCFDLFLMILYILFLAMLPSFIRWIIRHEQLEKTASFSDGSELSSPLLEAQERDVGSSAHSTVTEPQNATTITASLVRLPTSEKIERHSLRWIAYKCASYPLTTLTICFAIAVFFSLGSLKLQILTRPEDLWVGPDSQALKDKTKYEDSFGPYYRITQLILSTTSPSESIVTDDNIRLLFDMQDEIDALDASLKTNSDNSSNSIKLSDVCFKPIGSACATQSILEYWQGSRQLYESPDHLTPQYCIQHWSVACLAESGAPMNPRIILGGFPKNLTEAEKKLADLATAFIVTYPLVSDSERLSKTKSWESSFIQLSEERLKRMAEEAGLRLTFSTERSVQDELKRESGGDVMTVTFSYLIMLLYISLALGIFKKGSRLKEAMVQSRILLALGAVLLVSAAVLSSLGICGWFGIDATLIIMEVIPFLVLAIGIDNAFLLIQTADSFKIDNQPEESISEALAAVGPSMLFAAAAESFSFAIATLTEMPALKNFSACASLAVLLCFLFQITALPAMLCLDFKRQAQQRYDILPFLQADNRTEIYSGPDASSGLGKNEQVRISSKSISDQSGSPFTGRIAHDGVLSNDEFMLRASVQKDNENRDVLGISPLLQSYMNKVHIPVLAKPEIKGALVAAFIGFCFFGLSMIPRLNKGLDQTVVLPRDSYLQDYFADIAKLLRTGPPVTFVLRNLNISNYSKDVRNVCASAGCATDSLLNQINSASRSPWNSYIATPAASWIDDFKSWISPEATQCCRLFPNGTACPPPDQKPCWDKDTKSSTGLCDNCTTCLKPGELDPQDIPSSKMFRERLPQFLSAFPSQSCAKGGVGAYSNSFKRSDKDPSGIAGLSNGIIEASGFVAYYTPLSSQSDFISALESTRRMIKSISRSLELDIFPYSIFHMFFEQYLSIGGEAVAILGSAAVAIFVCTLLATGNPWAATILLAMLGSICINLAGIIALAGIQMNAVSLVNLAAAVGIGVEFCIHILHAFMEEQGTRQQRASAALSHVGASVLSGIGATKFFGVLVLAFAQTEVFKIYYFKFYLALVLFGTLHGIIFLPCILSIIGPDAFEGWRSRPFRRDKPSNNRVSFEVINASE